MQNLKKAPPAVVRPSRATKEGLRQTSRLLQKRATDCSVNSLTLVICPTFIQGRRIKITIKKQKVNH
ncbi:MAG: hypothetical protein ACJAVV_003913 [Alphaproteobacteria bacterium]|jgi:hypothetical protein